MQRYDEDPRGWRVLVGKDKYGFFDVLFSHGPELWQIKEHEVNPYKFVGYGAKLRGVGRTLAGISPYSFGLRPISEANTKELAGALDDPRTIVEIMSKIMSSKPVPSREALDGSVVLQGPVVQSFRPIELVSERQRELDRKLRGELEKLVQRKYRHTLTPYI